MTESWREASGSVTKPLIFGPFLETMCGFTPALSKKGINFFLCVTEIKETKPANQAIPVQPVSPSEGAGAARGSAAVLQLLPKAAGSELLSCNTNAKLPRQTDTLRPPDTLLGPNSGLPFPNLFVRPLSALIRTS